MTLASKSPASQQSSSDNVGLGVLSMVLCLLMFTSMDASAKLLMADGYSLAQVACARFFFHLLWMLVFLRGSGVIKILRSRVFGTQVMRAFIMASTICFFFAGLLFLDLATASAIMFLVPLLVTALSALVLGEAVGWRRWVGIFVGLIGALIIVRPGLGGLHWGACFTLMAAASAAVYHISTRKVKGIDPPLTAPMFSAIIGTIGAVLFLACAALIDFLGLSLFSRSLISLIWKAPDLYSLVVMAGIGFFGAVGQILLVKAYESAQASIIAPFSYSGLIWATIIGFMVFGDLPDSWTLVGAAIIATSGVYIFMREQKRQSEGMTR